MKSCSLLSKCYIILAGPFKAVQPRSPHMTPTQTWTKLHSWKQTPKHLLTCQHNRQTSQAAELKAGLICWSTTLLNTTPEDTRAHLFLRLDANSQRSHFITAQLLRYSFEKRLNTTKRGENRTVFSTQLDAEHDTHSYSALKAKTKVKPYFQTVPYFPNSHHCIVGIVVYYEAVYLTWREVVDLHLIILVLPVGVNNNNSTQTDHREYKKYYLLAHWPNYFA